MDGSLAAEAAVGRRLDEATRLAKLGWAENCKSSSISRHLWTSLPELSRICAMVSWGTFGYIAANRSGWEISSGMVTAELQSEQTVVCSQKRLNVSKYPEFPKMPLNLGPLPSNGTK